MPNFKHHVFICTKCSDSASKLRGEFKDAIKQAGLKDLVRINDTGCLNQCDHANVLVVYPEAVWYGFVERKDVAEIVQQHLEQGTPVQRLQLPESCINQKHCPHSKKK